MTETIIENVTQVSPVDVAISSLQSKYKKPEIMITGDFTVAVRAYINTMLANDPNCREQLEGWINQKKAMSEALHNDRGLSTGGEFKICINMPELLGLYVFKQFPEILDSKKNMYKFMKAFPEFTVPKVAFKTKYEAR